MPRTATYDEAVRNITPLLAAAEKGETIEIVRLGKTVAVITPPSAAPPAASTPSAAGPGMRSRGFRNR